MKITYVSEDVNTKKYSKSDSKIMIFWHISAHACTWFVILFSILQKQCIYTVFSFNFNKQIYSVHCLRFVVTLRRWWWSSCSIFFALAWTQYTSFMVLPFCHNCVHFADHAFLTLPILFHNFENMHNQSAAFLMKFFVVSVPCSLLCYILEACFHYFCHES